MVEQGNSHVPPNRSTVVLQHLWDEHLQSRTSAHKLTTAKTTLNQNIQPVINTDNTTQPANGPPRIMSTVFGALNRFISRLDAGPQEEQQSGVGGAHGFQVLRNANQEVPLEPWFDFIIGINGRTIVSAQQKGPKAH